MKLKLKQYYKILEKLEKIPLSLSKLGSIEKEKVLGHIPLLFRDSYPELVEILSIATEFDTEKIEDMTAVEVVELVEEIYEDNEFGKLFSKYKNKNSPKKKTLKS